MDRTSASTATPTRSAPHRTMALSSGSLFASPTRVRTPQESSHSGQAQTLTRTLRPFACADLLVLYSRPPSLSCPLSHTHTIGLSLSLAAPICHVRVYNSGSDGQRAFLARGFEIFIGSSYGDTTSAAAHNCAGLQEPPATYGPFDVTCDCRVGSYVTLRSASAGYLSLSELRVYAGPPPPPSLATSGCGNCNEYSTPGE